jgi:hypothetical protein
LESSEPCLLILDEMLTGCEDDQELWIQFVLDCSLFPSVIAAAQKEPAVLQLLFRATRIWCYSLHRTRLKLLGRWFSWKFLYYCIWHDQFGHYYRWLQPDRQTNEWKEGSSSWAAVTVKNKIQACVPKQLC